jgi:hypothetical protein
MIGLGNWERGTGNVCIPDVRVAFLCPALTGRSMRLHVPRSPFPVPAYTSGPQA